MISEKILNVIACPKCKGDLELKGQFMVCPACRLSFPILGDVPDMLLSDSWSLEKAKKSKFKHLLKL